MCFYIPPRLEDRKHKNCWRKIISNHKPWEILQYIHFKKLWYQTNTMYYLIFIWKNVHKKLQYQLSSSIPFSFRQRSLSSINCSGSSGHITANPVRRAWSGQLLKLTNAISLFTDLFWYNNEFIQLVFNGHQIDLSDNLDKVDIKSCQICVLKKFNYFH